MLTVPPNEGIGGSDPSEEVSAQSILVFGGGWIAMPAGSGPLIVAWTAGDAGAGAAGVSVEETLSSSTGARPSPSPSRPASPTASVWISISRSGSSKSLTSAPPVIAVPKASGLDVMGGGAAAEGVSFQGSVLPAVLVGTGGGGREVESLSEPNWMGTSGTSEVEGATLGEKGAKTGALVEAV